MSIDDLSTETLNRLKKSHRDRIIEKHEYPDSWEWQLKTRDYAPDTIIYQIEPDYDSIVSQPEFIPVGDHQVLLPVPRNHHPNITILHSFLGEDHTKLVI